MFIPRQTPDTVILRRSYETRVGTFTAGHRFTRIPESIGERVNGYVTLRDDEGRCLTLSHYEFERIT